MRNSFFRQTLYEAAFIILAVKMIFDSSSLFYFPEWVDTILILGFLGCIAWKLLLQIYTLKRLVFFALAGILVVYTSVNGSYFYILFSFFGIIAIQDVDLKQAIRKIAYTKIILIMIHVCTYLIRTLIAPGDYGILIEDGVVHYNFFLGHPNTFAMFVLWTSLEFIYSRYDKLAARYLVVIWLINVLTFLLSHSSTGIIVSTFSIACFLLDKANYQKIIAFVKPVSKYGFLFCSLLFPMTSVYYTRLSGGLLEAFYAVNDFFTGRLLYGAYAYDNYGFTWLGRTIPFPIKSFWQGHWLDGIIFDNSFLWMFVLYGYFYLFVISIAFIIIYKRTTSSEKILLAAYILYGIMEAYIINAVLCFPLLFIGKYYYDRIHEMRRSE